jgi:hypothetical protein
MSKFKKGDKVICVHDHNDVKQGDVLEVIVPSTNCCNGIIFKDRNYHYPQECFEYYKESDKPSGAFLIDEQGIMETLLEVERKIFYNQVQGVIPVDIVKSQLFKIIKALGLQEKMIP